MSGSTPPSGWQRAVSVRHVWTTVVTAEVRTAPGEANARAADAMTATLDFTAAVDAWFSPTRADATIAALRAGELAEPDVPTEVAAVLAGCRRARELTDGAFDPWVGGFNPSGYVKGWAADRMAQRLTSEVQRAGCGPGKAGVCVNAGGDVACRGTMAPHRPWPVGLSHPYRPESICAAVTIHDGAVATSGITMRGAHVLNPATRREAAAGIVAATVIGPDGGLADALATALVVTGPYGVRFLDRLPGWSALLVTGSRTLRYGPAFDLAA